MRRLLLASLLPIALFFGACGEWEHSISDTQVLIGDSPGTPDYRQAVLACQARNLALVSAERTAPSGKRNNVMVVTCR
jgi:hypothetical protein